MWKVRKFICGAIEQNNMCKGKITYLLFGETNQTQNANCNKVIIKWNLQHNKGVKKSWSQIAKNIKNFENKITRNIKTTKKPMNQNLELEMQEVQRKTMKPTNLKLGAKKKETKESLEQWSEDKGVRGKIWQSKKKQWRWKGNEWIEKKKAHKVLS